MTEKQRKILVGAAIFGVVGLGIGALAVYGALGKLFGPKVDRTAVEVEEGSTNDLEAEYGYATEETVANLVAKMNQKINNQADFELLSADAAAMVVNEEEYWYSLYEDVALVVVPTEFSGQPEKDVAAVTLIYADENSVNQEKAQRYFQCLVGANDEKLNAEEVDWLIVEAEKSREQGEMVGRGGGIFVFVATKDGHVEYQVGRRYRG